MVRCGSLPDELVVALDDGPGVAGGVAMSVVSGTCCGDRRLYSW